MLYKVNRLEASADISEVSQEGADFGGDEASDIILQPAAEKCYGTVFDDVDNSLSFINKSLNLHEGEEDGDQAFLESLNGIKSKRI